MKHAYLIVIVALAALACSSSTSSVGGADAAGTGADASLADAAVETQPDAPVVSPPDATPPPVDAPPVVVVPDASSPDAGTPPPDAMEGPDAYVPHLIYYGGPVLSHIKVVLVQWGPNVQLATEIAAMMTAVTDSPYLDWLSEYNTPTQTIGRGHLVANYVHTTAPADPVVTQQKVEDELRALAAASAIPSPDADTDYIVLFPPGQQFKLIDGRISCTDICWGFATSASNANPFFVFGMMPDESGGCATGCGVAGSATPYTKLERTTANLSAMLITQITSPRLGNFAPPLGWYEPMLGFISYICNAVEWPIVAGYRVSTGWSNARNACVATP